MRYKGLIDKYKQFLPVDDNTQIISLCEGNTPLIKADNLACAIGLNANLYLKYEGLNPTGSFKDRGMTMAVTKAKEDGSNAIICASTGNTSASAAAYAAKAKMKCCVLIPDGHIAMGKLSQALMYGAKVIAISGNFDEALCAVREISSKYPITLVNSVNPFRIEGQKTGAFEIVDDLNNAPDYHFIPVGNAGNITAYWKGYKEYFENNKATKLPKMYGIQAEGAAPIVRGYKIDNPETVATAIRIGNPASWQKAVDAKNESSGKIDMVSDEEILNAYRLLTRHEGIFAEPASCASVAGVIKFKNEIKENSDVVCVLTGNGIKDPDCAIKYSQNEIHKTSSKIEDILKVIGI